MAAAADETDLSQALAVLERDLTSRDYLDVLATMIPTDLAAEWQRVATEDNYHLFAERHGGVDKLSGDPVLKAAYARRRKIAAAFLDLMRGAYAKKNIRPPFDDEAVLTKALASATKRGTKGQLPDFPIRAIPPVAGAEKHWPSFRGPTGQGIVIDTQIPDRWSDSENVLWKAKLPGRGNSSPVVWGDRLFVTSEAEPRGAAAPLGPKDRAPERLLLCYALEETKNAAGEKVAPGGLLWQIAAPQPVEHETLYWKNTLASSTPATDGERVIAFFGNAGLLCTNLDGRRLWHADLGTFPTMHGPGTSPVIYKNLVIVIQDQTVGTSLCAAFDKRTGERVWQKPRPNAAGWSSPVLLRVGDRDELIYNGSNDVVSYDPATGDEVWKAAGTSIESIPSIVSGGGLLYSTSGRNGPMFALRPGGKGDITDTHVVWRHERGGPHVPTPAWHDGRLYVVSDTGVVTVIDAATGETLSQKRLRGRFSMAPLVIGDKLLLVSEEGVCYIAKSDPRLEIVARSDLKEPVLATPAVLGGKLYFRTAEHLICIGKPSAAVDAPAAAKPVKQLILPGESFLVENRPAFVLWPPQEKRRNPQPWIFYAPTLPAYPDEAEKWMHERFLAAGIAVAGIDCGEAYGSPDGQSLFTALYRELTDKHAFAAKPCLLGRSRGGLWVSSWAIANPEKVAGIAGIYPVFDLTTYPGLEKAAPAYGLTVSALRESLAQHNPIARIDVLARAKVPVFIIHGDDDKVVPLKQNSAELAVRYAAAGAGDAARLVVAKGQGHNFWQGFFQCQELVDFAIERANEGAKAAARQ